MGNLASQIAKILNDVDGDLKQKAREELKKVAQVSVERLKTTSPNNPHTSTNKYKDNWESEIYPTEIKAIIRQNKGGKKGSLTHLLNDGHKLVTKSGKVVGFVRGTSFFTKEEERVFKEFYERIGKIVDEVTK